MIHLALQLVSLWVLLVSGLLVLFVIIVIVEGIRGNLGPDPIEPNNQYYRHDR